MRGKVAAQIVEHEYPDAEAAAQAVAADIGLGLAAGIAARGAVSLVVSGGRSPVPLFAALRGQNLDWPKVWITLADERWVEADSADSNERLLREHLLIGAAAAAHFVPLKTAAATPALALAERTSALSVMPRPFDAVVLGMGEDGHFASLFPGAAGVDAALDPEGSAQLAAIQPPHAAHPRITLSLHALLDARRIHLWLPGAGKRRVFALARREAVPQKLPIAALLMQDRVPVEVHWIGLQD